MKILIEEHQYPAKAVEDVLDGITNLRDVDGKVDESKVKRFLDNLEVKNDKTPEPETQE